MTEILAAHGDAPTSPPQTPTLINKKKVDVEPTPYVNKPKNKENKGGALAQKLAHSSGIKRARDSLDDEEKKLAASTVTWSKKATRQLGDVAVVESSSKKVTHQ